MKKLISAIFFAVFAAAAMSADYTWNSAVSTGAWSDPANWLVDGATPAAAPGASDNVSFDGITATVTL